MPGFKISNFGGNQKVADHEARFYSTFTWEIEHLFVEDYSNKSIGEELGDPNNESSYGSFNKISMSTSNSKPSYSKPSISSSLPATILLKTAQLPSISYDQIKAKGGSIEYKFAGKPVYDPIKITFYDTEDLVRFMKSWSNSIWSRYSGLRTANRYKKKSVITKYLIDRDDNTSVVSDEFGPKTEGTIRYELNGSWPMVVKESDLTYVEAGIKTVDLTIMYDHCDIVILEG
jgi:hypothetical protein